MTPYVWCMITCHREDRVALHFQNLRVFFLARGVFVVVFSGFKSKARARSPLVRGVQMFG